MTHPLKPANCDYEGTDPISWDGHGNCRCLICGRCGHHTGNNTQGHLWGFCQVTKTVREGHYCCPGDCELETSS